MDVEALVAAITREVLKQMASSPSKEQVLILGEKGCSRCEALEKKLGDGVCCLYPQDAGEADASRRIIPFLSLAQMSALAQGRADDALMETVLRFLLLGETVEVMAYEYHQYADTAPEGLLSLYEAQKEQLESFGLVAVDHALKEVVRFRKALVTEADIEEASQRRAREVLLPEGTQVTPLAHEHAKNVGIRISRK